MCFLLVNTAVMDPDWKSQLIAQINRASDFESLKAGLLAVLADDGGPGVATSQDTGAQEHPAPAGLTRQDFLKNPSQKSAMPAKRKTQER